MLTDLNLANKRGINEDFKTYRRRLRVINKHIKEHLKGSLIWSSAGGNTYKGK